MRQSSSFYLLCYYITATKSIHAFLSSPTLLANTGTTTITAGQRRRTDGGGCGKFYIASRNDCRPRTSTAASQPNHYPISDFSSSRVSIRGSSSSRSAVCLKATNSNNSSSSSSNNNSGNHASSSRGTNSSSSRGKKKRTNLTSLHASAIPSSSNKTSKNKRNNNAATSTRNKNKNKSSTQTLRAPTTIAKSQRKDAGSWYQRDEMLSHEILTREDEFELGGRIVRARQIRDLMSTVLEEKDMRIQEEEYERMTMSREEEYDDLDGISSSGDFLDEETNNFMSIYSNGGVSTNGVDEPMDNANEVDTLLQDNQKDPFHMYSQFNPAGSGPVISTSDHRISSTLVQDGSKLSRSSLTQDVNALTEEDVILKLNLKGGKLELQQILHEGIHARDKLMKSNIRLVVSIAKKWMGKTMAAGNAEGSRMFALYNGGWDRPSLDEVVQEGVLGLARAADKFDPDRGLRFSTYSTHWITSYVRQCFQTAATGCLKVPSQLHEIKNAHRKILKRQYELSQPFPTEKEVAAEIGVSPSRLRTAIRVTEALLSIDEPISLGGNSAFKGSAAGGDYSGDNGLLISDRLECSETAPEEHVEISFLRQTLENAMAAELSPHERDILRLRLGLDDGQTRTVREVVEECGGAISIADVRSAERRAFKKLRSPNALHAHNLLEYMEMSGIEF